MNLLLAIIAACILYIAGAETSPLLSFIGGGLIGLAIVNAEHS